MTTPLDGYYRIRSPFGKDPTCEIDLALITHPRDLLDIRRMLPWTANVPDPELLAMLKWTRPILNGFGTVAGQRTANVFIPRVSEQFCDRHLITDVRHLVIEALEMAERFGARVAVMGGLVSSVMRHGTVKALREFQGAIRTTTGHATTALCVCSTLKRAVAASGVPLANRRVAFLGMGSIGSACASWLAHNEPHIREITLCDVRIKQSQTRKLGTRLEKLGYRGPVRILVAEAPDRVPDELYESDVLVSATNRPHLVDISRVRPGSILVDDSQPWCWSRKEALERFQRKKDVLCLEGGLLSGNECSTHVNVASMGFARETSQAHSSTIWSCMGEGLLMLTDSALPATRGAVGIPDMETYEARMEEAGIAAAPLQCGGTFYSPGDFREFYSVSAGQSACAEGVAR